MLISKFNLYNDEWLDVVFANRNKEYGAYELRKHHGRDTLRALLIALSTITIAATAYGMAIRVEPVEVFKKTDVDTKVYTPPPPPKKEEIKKRDPVESKPAPPQNTKKFVVMKPVEKPPIEEPAKIDELKDAVVASVDNKVPGGGPATNASPVSGGDGGGEGSGEGSPNTIFTIAEFMPQPIGGNEAWAKFLQKNIKYPQMALSEGASGKVYVSFIVEKDGSLSNITVLKGPGFGLDEEAVRVLKKAPAWKPGIQNGQPVRVKFTIPISFSMGDE